MPPVKLAEDARKLALNLIPHWKEVVGRDAIERKFRFKDFKQAWIWMSKVAEIADEKNHHPEWFNVYNRVDVVLSTHDCGGISQLDIDLAQNMDKLYDAHTS